MSPQNKYILSLGAGQQSSAMAIMIANKDPRLEEYWGIDCVFADTGGEHPKTYVFLKELEPYLKKRGMKIIHVQNKKETLYDNFIRYKSVPMMLYRYCTVHWKIKPIEKVLDKDIIYLIGYTIEEKKRAKKLVGNRITPLIDIGYTRNDCIKEIRKVGLKVPPKSGCYFCSFQKKKEWQKLYKENPELFKKCQELEENSNLKIASNGLVSYVPASHKDQKSLCEYGGYCNL